MNANPPISRRESIATTMLAYLDSLPVTAANLTYYAMEANGVVDVVDLVPEYRREVDDLLRIWHELAKIRETPEGWVTA